MLEKLFRRKIIKIDNKEYKLEKVTAEQLFKYRLGKNPGLVFKQEHDLWYTELPEFDTKFTPEETKAYGHLCSSNSKCCIRLSAAPDPIGCACMRDISFSSCRTSKNRVFHCDTCLRIEKYPFIIMAIETFNMKEDALKVLECTDCVREKKNPVKMKEKDLERKILALAQNLYPELEDLDDISPFPKLEDDE